MDDPLNLDALRFESVPASAANAIQISFTTDKDAAIGHGRRRVDWFSHGVRAEYLVFRTGFDYEGVSIFTREKYLSIEGYR